MDRNFEKFYRQHADSIYRYLFLRAGSREEAEDLTGDVFLKAYRVYTGQQDRPWLFKVARNTLIDHWRRKRPLLFSQLDEFEIEDLPSGEDIERAGDSKHKFESVVEALLALTPEQQEVIVLRFVEDMSYEQVSAIMRRREDAVRAIQSRAIKKLKQILKWTKE